MFEIIGEKWVVDTIPNIEFQYNGFASVIKIRKLAQAYIGFETNLDSLMIKYPKFEFLNTSQVFDTFILFHETSKGYSLHFILKSSGDYQDYNLKINDLKDHDNDFDEGIEFLINNSNRYYTAKCLDADNKENENCKIEKINRTHICLNLHAPGRYYIKEGDQTCQLETITITSTSMLFISCITLCIYFLLRDRKS